MTDTSTSRGAARASGRPDEISGWTGWVVFAGIMLAMMGAFQVIEGLVAIFNQCYYLVGPAGLVVSVDYTWWGWVHLILGVVAVAAGFGLIAGNMAARVVGVIVAMISAVLNLAFLAAYPFWASIIIVVDVVVIYAIVAHGRELKA
jgi:hypothetical protein